MIGGNGVIDVDCITELNDCHKKLRYEGHTFAVTDITLKNQHGVRYLVVEAMEEQAYIEDLQTMKEELDDE